MGLTVKRLTPVVGGRFGCGDRRLCYEIRLGSFELVRICNRAKFATVLYKYLKKERKKETKVATVLCKYIYLKRKKRKKERKNERNKEKREER